VEEAAKFDLDTFGVGNIMARRADNHVDTVAAELDADFFAKAKTAGTKLTAKGTTVEDQLEELIQAVETVKNDYVRGVPRNLIRLVLDPVMYGRARNYLDKGTNNANVDTAAEDFRMFHGVRVYSSINLPAAPGTTATRALCMVDGAMAQPVVMYPYAEPEKIPLSNDYGVSMFYDYGTKALTPDLIFYMPMTFSQVWTIAKNIALEAFTPVLTLIGQGAQWIYDNWSMIAPVFWGLAAAALGYAVALGIQTAATWIANGAAQAFFTTLLTNPLFWIALAIGVVVAAIYKWVQSVGGLKVAWLICVNAVLTAWDWVKIGFMTGVYFVMNLWNRLQLAFYTASVNIQNFMGDMKAGVLTILQNMVNGAIDIINGFINTLNKIPGVSIDAIEKVTFGTTAQMENDAAKQARAADLSAYQDQINSQIAERDSALSAMKSEARAATAQREAEIAAVKAESAAAGNGSTEPDWSAYANTDPGDIGNVDRVGSVGSIDEDVNIADEDLKFLRDVAEMRYVQNFVTLTPTVAVDAKISEKVDVDEVVDKIERRLETEFEAAAEGVYA